MLTNLDPLVVVAPSLILNLTSGPKRQIYYNISMLMTKHLTIIEDSCITSYFGLYKAIFTLTCGDCASRKIVILTVLKNSKNQ